MNIPTTSTTLLRDIAQDSQNARWSEFVARYRPMMEAFLRERFPSIEADDIIQETLAALCKVLPDYQYAPDEKGRFNNYLTGILRNKAIRVLRKRMSDCEKLVEYADFGRAASMKPSCGRDALVASDGRARSPVSPERSEPRKRWLQGCALHPKTADGRACRPTTAAEPVLADLGLVKAIASPSAEHQTSNPKLQTLTIGGVGTPGYGSAKVVYPVGGLICRQDEFKTC